MLLKVGANGRRSRGKEQKSRVDAQAARRRHFCSFDVYARNGSDSLTLPNSGLQIHNPNEEEYTWIPSSVAAFEKFPPTHWQSSMQVVDSHDP
jgi:hypothetical protein